MKEYNDNQSPVKKESFIWIAEYDKEDIHKRTYLSEYEFLDGGFGHLSHTFDEINKENLTYLGLIGNGYRFFYDIEDGKFNVYNSKLELTYYDKDLDKEYIFMDKFNSKYNDIILYKTVADEYDTKTSMHFSCTVEYGLGYKKKISDFFIEAIFHIPMENNMPTFFTYKITSNKDINGELRFYLDNKLSAIIDSGLKANIGKTFKINIE